MYLHNLANSWKTSPQHYIAWSIKLLLSLKLQWQKKPIWKKRLSHKSKWLKKTKNKKKSTTLPCRDSNSGHLGNKLRTCSCLTIRPTEPCALKCTKAPFKHHVHSQFNTCSRRETPKSAMACCSCYSLFQAVLGLPIAFSASVEGSVIEMKPATLIPEDNAVSLKA